MPGTVYTRKGINRINELEVLSPHAWGRATDTAAENGLPRTEALLAARDAATAGRWARGLLLSANRQLERLTVMQDFHSSWTAMVKVEITGDTAANGAWLIDEVHHDFVNGTSRAELLRCVETVK